MKLIKRNTFKIIAISTVCCFCLILIQSQILATNLQITVDVDHVIATFANNPVGMNLNFLLDKETIIEPARQLKLGSLRYPMGEIADYYLFDRNHPDKPKISIQDSSLWINEFAKVDGTWKNPLNFDQFIRICRSLNTEPFIVIGIDALAYQGKSPRADLYEVLQSAVDWVEYANIIQGYNVKHWEIGNENDLAKTHLNWTAENYAQTVVKFARAMKQVDPSIKIGANGMTGIAWWDMVMPIVKNDIDFLVTHQYSSMKNYKQWNSNNFNYIYNLRNANKVIEKYNPALRLNVTEHSSSSPGQDDTNNIWKMLHNFELIGNSLGCDRVDYLHFWISRWFSPDPYSTDANAFNKNYELMPMAYPLKIWGNFIHQQMVFATTKKGSIRSWASYDPHNTSLSLFLLNKSLRPKEVSVSLKNYDGARKSHQWILSGESPSATKPILQQSTNPEPLEDSKISLELQPLSVTAIAFEK
jgi:alpha-L-arabinofuranosidase